jgi:hypothetical protein
VPDAQAPLVFQRNYIQQQKPKKTGIRIGILVTPLAASARYM